MVIEIFVSVMEMKMCHMAPSHGTFMQEIELNLGKIWLPFTIYVIWLHHKPSAFHVYACVYVCFYTCTYVGMHEYLSIYISTHPSIYVYIFLHVYNRPKMV